MSKTRITGFKETERALADIGKKSTQLAVTRRALMKAAEPMKDEAIQKAPENTGKLKSSIVLATRAGAEAGKAAYAATMRSGGDKGAALAALRAARRAFKDANPPAIVYLGPTPDAWHARFAEFGTRPRTNGGMFAGSQHPGTAPHPFLRPAFDSQAGPTIDRLGPLMWEEIQRNAARAAKRAAKAKG